MIVPRLDGIVLPLRTKFLEFGILLDLALSGNSQIAAMSRSTFDQLQLIVQLHPFLENGSLRTLVQALVISQINYCNALYRRLPLKLTWRLQGGQNAAARLVIGANRSDSTTPVLAHLH